MAFNPIKPVSRTFTTILDDINTDDELRSKPNWFKRLIAGIGDVISMWVNVAANLAFLRTAFTRQSVADHLQLIDYQLSGYSTSSGTMIFDVIRTAIFPLTFTKEDLISSTIGTGLQSAKRFEARTGYTFNQTIETFVANTGTDQLTIAGAYTTGEIVRVTTTNLLPDPLVIDTDYFVIVVDSTHIRLATTRTNAYNDPAIYIDLTDIGTGTQSIQKFSFTSTGYQQETKLSSASIGVSDGITEWQKFIFPDAFVLTNTLTIVISGDTWTKVTTLVESGPADKHYIVEFLADNNRQVSFGNGVYGAIPGNFDIEVSYAVGGGANSNVSVINQINQYAGSNANISGASNPETFTGGADEQSLDEAKVLGPLLLKAQNRFVTSPDGEALSQAFEGVSLAKVIRNAYGVLSAQVAVVPDGGGVPSGSLISTLQTFLIDRTVLESIDVRVTAPDYQVIAPDVSYKVKTGYIFADIDDYVRLALTLLFTETAFQLNTIYESSGIVDAVNFINNQFSFTFDSSDYTQINKLLLNLDVNDFGKDFQESDIIGYIDIFVDGVDYAIYNSAIPITNTDDQITQIGTITTGEIT